jgi:hypothetical protein
MAEAARLVRDLGVRFWEWRAVRQPRPRDDIPRIERPSGWVPDWSPESVAASRNVLAGFEQELKAIDPAREPVEVQVDYRLVGCALARVRWELDHVRGWERNADFYVDQTLGAFYDVLLLSTPWDETRAEDLLRQMRRIPVTLAHAHENLGADTQRPFARIAISELRGIDERFDVVLRELRPHLSVAHHRELASATREVISVLDGFTSWLESRLPELVDGVAVGRESFQFFLSEVALLPYTPEQMVSMARQEAERALLFERLERIRNAKLPELEIPASAEAQVERERRDEAAMRYFYEERGILTQPPSLAHYWTQPLPDYIAPLKFLGVTNDLTGPSRLADDAINYVPAPHPDMGFFYLANAKDPRAGIMHEGAHYQQLALSWALENPLRRHYYDSGPNEGIAFYNEEMLLQAGLFDDSPRTREIVYRFLRLRALRVEFDVGLCTGELDVPGAIQYLVDNVPMDPATAEWETGFSASIPGFALTYQIGKLQLVRFLADAARTLGDQFDLRAFHDYVWQNGNVPIALLRWEYLDSRDELDIIDAARPSTRTNSMAAQAAGR